MKIITRHQTKIVPLSAEPSPAAPLDPLTRLDTLRDRLPDDAKAEMACFLDTLYHLYLGKAHPNG